MDSGGLNTPFRARYAVINDSDQVALVTGAARGIGLEVCRQLAQRGVSVILSARKLEQAREAAEHLADEGLAVTPYRLDVSSPRQIAKAEGWLRERFGRFDILVNNAVVVLDGEVPGVSLDLRTFDQALDVNLRGPLLLCQTLVPLMRERGRGRIVNVSSGLAQIEGIGAGDLAYKVSKAGLHVVTRVLADELRGDGIHVNAVCPGWVQTQKGGRTAERTPEEAADTIVWLALQGDGGPSGGFFRDRGLIPW